MTQKENNILELPIPADWESEKRPKEDVRLVYEARLSGIQFLNKVALGICKFTQEDRSRFYRYNALCVKTGYPHMQISVSQFPPSDGYGQYRD